MTRKELYNVLDDAVGNMPRVDLAEAAWAQGVGMRRRRRAAFAGGGTVLAAAAVVGALVISGGIAPDEDVAPAVPTSTPGPTQVEPGPVAMESAVTFMFHREGTHTDLETSSLHSLADQEVPAVDQLTGSSWELQPMLYAPGAEDFIDIAFAGPDDAGVTEPTTLSFMEAEDGDTLLSMSIDECGGATFQEDLVLAEDGRFAGQPAGTDDQGCLDGVQAAEDFWMEALPAGGWLHQPHEDVLLLSVIVPEGAAPTQETTEEPTGETTEDPTGETTADPTGGPEVPGAYATRTFVLLREGSEADTDELAGIAALPSLDDVNVASQDQLVGTAWTLHTDPELSTASDAEPGEPVIGDGGTIEADVPTRVSFADDAAGTVLSVELSCGPVRLQDDLGLDAGGWFPGQSTWALYEDCPEVENRAASFWMTFLKTGGWLHQPSEDVLLLTVVIPENMGSDSERDPAPEQTEDPGTNPPPAGTVSIGGGYAITLPDGWTDIALTRHSDSDPLVDSTCLLPEGESELFNPFRWCTVGAEIRVGVDPEAASVDGGWWDPGVSNSTEECYVVRQGYGHPDNEVTFAPDPETGSTTVSGHPVEWSRWSASCADGQEFTAEVWRVTDLGIELRSLDGSQDLEPLVQTLLLSGDVTAGTQVVMEVTEPIGANLAGELVTMGARSTWNGTGEFVTYEVTADTRCLVTKPGGERGADLQLGEFADLEAELPGYPYLIVIINPDGEAVSVRPIAGF
ncbi:hypothetical protein [Ornithinimicrobium faecis]|uniref:hypothetical protein n=1 Tax=Ornithinimicrobium faecis TaxID=2934158 RepID=UPI00211844CC|nr:hypothetical protein [Ornithinimicrobium sp. HY1745]